MRSNDQHYGEENYNTEKHLRMLIDVISRIDIEGKDVLDIGAGNGWCGKEYLKLGARNVISIDINPITEKIHKMDMIDLKFVKSLFDIVNCHGSLHHCKNPQKAVQEASRVLQKGGLFILTGEAHFNRTSRILNILNRYLFQYIILPIYSREEWKNHGKMYLKEEYDAWCKKAGLIKIQEGIYQKNE
jgi:ubiquinone/menaquinone biosynthesis C-methylase UbiE